MISSGHTDSNLRADRPCFNKAVWDKCGYHANDDRDANGTRLQRMNNSNSPQPNMEAGEAHTVESRGRGRGSNARQRRKRPEVQIYVPRAKRLQQQGGNNPTQNVEPSTNDNNSHHCTHPHNRSSSLVTSRVGGELNIERRSLSPQSVGRGRAKPKDFHDDKHRQSLKKIRKDNSVSEKKSMDKNAPTFQNSDTLHDLQTVNVSETEVRFPGNKDHHSVDIKCETLDILEGQNDSVSLMGGSSNTLISANQIVPQNSSSGQNSPPECIEDVGVNSVDRFYDALEEKGVISNRVGARNADVLQVEEEKESSDLRSNLSCDNEQTKSTNLSDTERQTTSGLKTEVCLVENVRIETSSSFNENTGSSLHSEQHQIVSEASGNLSIEAERVAPALSDNDEAALLSECGKVSFTMSDEKDMSNNQDGVSLLSSCDSYNDQQDSAKELPESDYQSDSTALENQNSPSTGETADNAMHLDDLQRDKINVQCSDKQTVDTPLQSGELERLTTRVEDSTAEHLSGDKDFDKQSTQIMSEPAAFSDSFSDKIVKPSEGMQNTSKEEKLSEDCGNLISSEMASNANDAEVEISKTIGEVGTENADVLQVKDEQDVETDIPMEKAAKTEILDKPLMGKSGEHSVSEEGAAMDTDDEESWDKLFTEDGDCLDPKVMEELTAAVGSVKVEKPQAQNYYKYQPKSADLDFEAYDHVLEISEFPAAFLTRDLISAFQAFMSRGFDIKWVDDTHALGIFSSAIAANEALSMQHPLLKVKPLSEADRQSKVKAKRSVEFLQPYKPRPETSASAARRLVTGALGLAPRVSREKREQERQQMREAKARRKQDKKNKEDAWEGNYGKCAMDEDS